MLGREVQREDGLGDGDLVLERLDFQALVLVAPVTLAHARDLVELVEELTPTDSERVNHRAACRARALLRWGPVEVLVVEQLLEPLEEMPRVPVAAQRQFELARVDQAVGIDEAEESDIVRGRSNVSGARGRERVTQILPARPSPGKLSLFGWQA